MKTWIIKLWTICSLVAVCCGCEVNEGMEPVDRTQSGYLLFQSALPQVSSGCALVANVVALDQYQRLLEQDDEQAAADFHMRYFADWRVLKTDVGYSIRSTGGALRYDIRIKDGLPLSDSDAEWRVVSVDATYNQYDREEALFTRGEGGELMCRYSNVERYDNRESASEWTIEVQEDEENLLLSGGGEQNRKRDDERVEYRITEPLDYNRLHREFVKGCMTIELHTPRSVAIETADAKFETTARVRIHYAGASKVYIYR